MYVAACVPACVTDDVDGKDNYRELVSDPDGSAGSRSNG
jgi:hypothetical protein